MSLSLSLLQALQLAASLPCLFIIGFLLFINRDWTRIIIPIGFFISLIASFAQSLIPLFNLERSDLQLVLLFLESLQPALCFLLILQLLHSKLPPWPYWFILAVPIIGGSLLIYGVLMLQEDVCVLKSYCVPPVAIQTLYQVFAVSLMFLWLIVHYSTVQTKAMNKDHTARQHLYWLIVALIIMNLSILGVDLIYLAGNITHAQHHIIIVVLRLSFIYLVLTSLFRVFDRPAALGMASRKSEVRVAPELITRIEQTMREDKLYREMGFSRETLAAQLNVPEYAVSRALNQHFGKHFNEFINGYRVEEAKERLRQETTSITVIAFEVGFSSIASFNRVFRALADCSPTEYRARHTAEKNA